MPEHVSVVGITGERAFEQLDADARAAIETCELLIASRRLLDSLALPAHITCRSVVLGSDIEGALDAVEKENGRVCVLASGDPGFFGILRPLSARLGPETIEVHPAPSSVSVAFARLGIPWDDAVVVSAHGRPLAEAVRHLTRARKAAVLVSPDNPPEAVGKALLSERAPHARTELRVAVCSRLGTDGESIVHTDLEGLAAGTWDPMSVVVLVSAGRAMGGASISWGLPDGSFEHRDGMLTKSEVRAVALGKLGIPDTGVMWDVGAGSASVAIEASLIAPGLDVYAIERDGEAARRAEQNRTSHSASVRVVEGEAPGALEPLPDPDRAFVGGGGIEVLEAVLERLRPEGRIVATFASLDRAARAAQLLGELIQIGVARAEPLPGGGVRLEAQNPVFVAWGRRP